MTPAGNSSRPGYRPDGGFRAPFRAWGAWEAWGARGACLGKHRDPPKTLSDFRSSTLVPHRDSGRHRGVTHRTCHSKSRVSAGIMLCLTSVCAFTPANLNELKTAKTSCLNEASSGNCPNFEATNGKIGTWDVSSVSTLASTFLYASAFNQPIGDWDISSVSTLGRTFSSASAFNQPIGDWDISSVSTLAYTFYSASDFNQPIGDWNVAKVTSMQSMLASAGSFNQTPWCTPSWGVSLFPEQGYIGPISARVLCCMQGEYLQNVCQKCQLGKYQDQDYTQIDSCAKCPRNRISPLNGAINCSSCGPGKFSNGRTECTACPSGSHQVDYDTHSNCSECVEGRYQPDEGERACLDCDKGQYQDEKAKQYCLP